MRISVSTHVCTGSGTLVHVCFEFVDGFFGYCVRCRRAAFCLLGAPLKKRNDT